MKKLLLVALSAFSLSTAILFVAVPTVEAESSCNGVKTSLDYGCDQYNTDSVSSILMYIINFLGIGVGIAVVAGIAWGGLTYARSGGDSGAAKEGMDTIRNAIIGLVLFITLWGLANFFIPGGAFNLNAKVATPTPTTPPSSSPPTTPTPTTPNLSGVKNFRDVGVSGVMKPGVLFRSARLYEASDSDVTKLSDLLKDGTVIDLRTAAERAKAGDKKLSDVSSRNIGIAGTTDYTKFVNGKGGETASAAFGQAIKAIAYADGPVLVHCTYGKDRTGWTVAMIMYALGASNSQVMQEYLKSSGQTGGKNVTKEMLNNGLSAIKANKKYGTIEKYLTKGLKLTKDDIAALKKKLGV